MEKLPKILSTSNLLFGTPIPAALTKGYPVFPDVVLRVGLTRDWTHFSAQQRRLAAGIRRQTGELDGTALPGRDRRDAPVGLLW